MKYETSALILAFLSAATAAPVRQAGPAPAYRLRGREVPQEHSHNTFLDSVRTSLALNNPDGIVDPVFGLLGNAAAAAGLGKITDPDCLHQATADQAFTNAKAAADVTGMTGALIYAALERNSGKIGLKSVLCTAIKAKNPEIAAISQHQDPASDGAAAANKAITLALAKQIASIGGDPQQALKSGTFAPGDLNDATAKGNTCDTADDEPGCIFTLNLLVEDATAAEIDAAVAGTGAAVGTTAAAVATTAAAAVGTSACPAQSTVTVTSIAAAVTDNAAVATDAASACPAQVTQTATVTVAAAAVETTAPATACARKMKRALDLGSCADATIVFGAGFDGRTDNSFKPNDPNSFSHGSALGQGVITSFICQQLNDKCKAPQASVDACLAAAKTASTLTGQAAADAFNAGVGGAATSTTGDAAAATDAAACDTPAATTSVAAAAATTAAASTGSSTNVQSFTGALGGLPPPVNFTEGAARPFEVKGDTFINKGAATQRSCAVQHNACSNAANSGTLAGGQAQCEPQETACNAANA